MKIAFHLTYKRALHAKNTQAPSSEEIFESRIKQVVL